MSHFTFDARSQQWLVQLTQKSHSFPFPILPTAKKKTNTVSHKRWDPGLLYSTSLRQPLEIEKLITDPGWCP